MRFPIFIHIYVIIRHVKHSPVAQRCCTNDVVDGGIVAMKARSSLVIICCVVCNTRLVSIRYASPCFLITPPTPQL